jgi:hypothetical protein
LAGFPAFLWSASHIGYARLNSVSRMLQLPQRAGWCFLPRTDRSSVMNQEESPTRSLYFPRINDKTHRVDDSGLWCVGTHPSSHSSLWCIRTVIISRLRTSSGIFCGEGGVLRLAKGRRVRYTWRSLCQISPKKNRDQGGQVPDRGEAPSRKYMGRGSVQTILSNQSGTNPD